MVEDIWWLWMAYFFERNAQWNSMFALVVVGTTSLGFCWRAYNHWPDGTMDVDRAIVHWQGIVGQDWSWWTLAR
jgi:hypothetical protein